MSAVSELVSELEVLISASKDETSRLERKLRKIRDECPHAETKRTVSEHLYLGENAKTTEDTCADCGKVTRRVVERRM